MDVLLVIDMQEGLLRGDAKYNLTSVVERINRRAERVRRRGGCVIFVQHDSGYRVSGKWSVVIGCKDAKWCALSGLVMDGDAPRQMKPSFRPYLLPDTI